MGDRTLVVSVRGEVVAIHLSTQAVQWRLSEIVAQATVVQARVQASEAEQAPKSTLSKVHLDPTEASALEAIGSVRHTYLECCPSITNSIVPTEISFANPG